MSKFIAKLIMFFTVYFMVYTIIFKLIFYRYDWLVFSLGCTIFATMGYIVAKLIRDKLFQMSIAVIFTVVLIFITGVILNKDWWYVFETTCIPFTLALLLW